MHNFYKMIHVI